MADFLEVIVINSHEFEQTQGDSERQGSLACCSPRGRKESDKRGGKSATEQLTEQQHSNQTISLETDLALCSALGMPS